MTSPLVKPAAGYITLSRLDSSRSRPSTAIGSRSPAIVVLLRALRWCLVVTQPQEPGETQAPVRRAVAVSDLHHQFRSYPMGSPRILPRNRTGPERRRLVG